MRIISKSAFIATSVTALLNSCAATPDSNGSATLTCSGAMIPSHDLVIEPLFDRDKFTVACGKSREDLPAPQKLQFRVYEIVKSNLPKPKSNSGSSESGNAQNSSSEEEEEIRVPRGGIAFAPAIQSSLVLAAKRTATEFQVDPSKCSLEKDAEGNISDPKDCLISPHEFMGVVTPRDQWCSDTAGVMTYEIWITCNGNSSSFEAGVISGGIKTTGSYSFEVTAEEL